MEKFFVLRNTHTHTLTTCKLISREAKLKMTNDYLKKNNKTLLIIILSWIDYKCTRKFFANTRIIEI